MDVVEYENTRYKNPDQRLIDRLEKKFVLKVLVRLSPLDSVLDIPCGYGRFSKLLIRFSKHYTPADIEEGMLRRLEEKFNVKGVVANISELPFRDSTFEMVFTMRLFQHLKDDEVYCALSELNRVTKRWALFSFYRNTVIHRIERKLSKRRSSIKMREVSLVRDFLKKRGFDAVFMHPIIRGLHSQTLVLARKKL